MPSHYWHASVFIYVTQVYFNVYFNTVILSVIAPNGPLTLTINHTFRKNMFLEKKKYIIIK